MNNILMVGDTNLLIENLYEFLSSKYKIQICEAVDTTVSRMYKIIKPNIILLIKSSAMEDGFMLDIKASITETPIICICGEGDLGAKRFAGGNMNIVFRPINNNDILERIKELTGEGPVEKSLETYDGLFVKKEKHRILAIDDNPMVLRGLKQLLDVEYDIMLATSVDAAKKQIEKKDFELILLDYEMPEVNGYEAYKFFTRNPLTANVPVVFLTGVSDKERISELAALNPKPAGYLLKPIDSELLKATIKRVLKK